jgi:simple sugar transport system ATP-binding protein
MIAALALALGVCTAAGTAGAAILLISSELDELLALCDRIAVLYEGRRTPTDFPTTSREEIGRLMAGLSPAHAAPEARA